MGKLNIAHHKSYHPYRRDNIERVRRDEEEARQTEAVEEGRMMLADSEARMDLLRQRAGAGKGKKRKDDEDISAEAQAQAQAQSRAEPSSLISGGHINFFEDVERQLIPVARRPREPAETEKGIPLAPAEKDLKPWYSDRDPDKSRELNPDRKLRDLARKSVNDPLTSINTQLAARSGTPISSNRAPARRALPASASQPQSNSQGAAPSVTRPPELARLTRESSERARAQELIRRRKRELAGSETPSTVYGGVDERGGAYGDVFNRQDVEEAHRHRERRWDGQSGVRSRW
ncbi:hypothetical protein BKA93DRAFT_735815 [Sparassis latifolia]